MFDVASLDDKKLDNFADGVSKVVTKKQEKKPDQNDGLVKYLRDVGQIND